MTIIVWVLGYFTLIYLITRLFVFTDFDDGMDLAIARDHEIFDTINHAPIRLSEDEGHQG